MFKVGQWIYAIDVVNEDYEPAEVSAYLFMAECKDYIICCSEYFHCTDDFDAQLEEMCEESAENCGSVDVAIIRKDLCFETQKQAEETLLKLMEECE